MAISFPTNPNPGDTYTSGGVTWKWDGTKWIAVPTAGTAFLPLSGGQMNGPLLLVHDGVQALEAVTVEQLNAAGATAGTSPPASPLLGKMWFDTAGAQLYVWNGSAWIVAVNPPMPNTANFLQLSGGTVTGNLAVLGTSYTLPASGSATSWPSAAAPGTVLDYRLSTTSMVINGYWNGTNWAQLPGMGSGGLNSGSVYYGVTSGANGSANFGYAPPAADNAAVTPQTWLTGNMTQSVFYSSLQVNMPAGAPAITFTGANSSGAELWVQFTNPVVPRTWAIKAEGGGGFAIADITGVADRIQIDTSGNCKNTTGTWSAFSDPRLKENVASYTTGLNAILALEPISFRYNGKGGTAKEDAMRYGLDAKAIQKVLPEAVHIHQGKLDPDDKHRTDILTADGTGPIVLALINAVKELTARLKAVEGS